MSLRIQWDTTKLNKSCGMLWSSRCFISVSLVWGFVLISCVRGQHDVMAEVTRKRFAIADLTSRYFRIVFPSERGRERYAVSEGGFFDDMIVGPDGRSVFGVASGPGFGQRRVLTFDIFGSSPEAQEVLVGLFPYVMAVAPAMQKEDFLVLGYQHREEPGLFYVDTRTGTVRLLQRIDLGRDHQIEGMAVTDGGGFAVFSQDGKITLMYRDGDAVVSKTWIGQFPALKKDGRVVFFRDGSMMEWNRGKTSVLFASGTVIRSIRLSPDEMLVAFGRRIATGSELVVCNLLGSCQEVGPFWEDKAGRNTFWLRLPETHGSR